jgi:dihydrofolate reductase
MWRKTWESIPSKYRPLPDRINCILSRTLKVESNNSQIDDFVLYFNDFNHCLKELNSRENIEKIFLIWGGSLYNQFLNHPNLEKIYMTKVFWDHDCDVFFDWIPKEFKLESYWDEIEEKWFKYRFEVWSK